MAMSVLSSCVRFASGALVGLGVACNAIVDVEEGQLDPGTLDALLCSDSCPSNQNGQCDDGGLRADTDDCTIGTDCADCGPRTIHAPDTDIGNSCISTADCSATPHGFCASIGICTRECANHQDCGCPAGTGDDDVMAGRCAAACLPDSTHTLYCMRVCGADAHCDAPSVCILFPSIGLCAVPS